MKLREFALQLLSEYGCSLDCYKGVMAKYALVDVQSVALERELPYLPEDIAAELVRIGNEQPDPPRAGHKQFEMIFDVGHTIDGIEYDDLEEAKSEAIQTLVQWVVDEQISWRVDADGIPHPTEEQVESWDRMIAECCVYVVEWDEDAERYEDDENAWYPSAEDEAEAEFMYWEELRTKHGWPPVSHAE